MITLAFFISIALIISYIDIKKTTIADNIIIPAIFILILLKWYYSTLFLSDFIAAAIVFFIFLIPIALNMAFGGGDLRYGVFCSIFLGLAQIGIFLIFCGIIHLLILLLIRKKVFAFAPAMSIAVIISYIIGIT